jgi:hypothetical protein
VRRLFARATSPTDLARLEQVETKLLHRLRCLRDGVSLIDKPVSRAAEPAVSPPKREAVHPIGQAPPSPENEG